jgi:rhamnosyltransferase
MADNTKQNMASVQHVFVIGSKSIGQYGGYETFVDKLTEQHQNDPSIKYHIACKANGDGYMDESKLSNITVTKKNNDGSVAEFEYKNAHVFKIPCPNIGPAVAIYYDRAALQYSIRYCEENRIFHPIIYILTCRIGPFISHYAKQIQMLGGKYYLNPDGDAQIISRKNVELMAA